MIDKDILTKHDERITTLEKSDQERIKQINELERSHRNLENTIVQENRETRMIFQSTMNKQWDMIKSSQDLNNERVNKEYELRRADQQAAVEINKTKWSMLADVSLKLVGSGSLIYVVVTNLFNAQ